MKQSSVKPDQHTHVNIYAENSRPIHRHDQSEGSEFLDDAIHMHDLDELISPSRPLGKSATSETERPTPPNG